MMSRTLTSPPSSFHGLLCFDIRQTTLEIRAAAADTDAGKDVGKLRLLENSEAISILGYGLVLRGLDGWLERCSYRQIAKVLFGPNSIPAGRGWKTHELRGRTIRLCSRGRDLMHGAYLNLLRHPGEFRS
jgi:hypothetical protein